MWFIAHTHEGLRTIQLRSAYADEFPRFRHYHSGNTIGHYHYLSADLSAGDVTGLQADQVLIFVVLSLFSRYSLSDLVKLLAKFIYICDRYVVDRGRPSLRRGWATQRLLRLRVLDGSSLTSTG